jgi:hypothetical protein
LVDRHPALSRLHRALHQLLLNKLLVVKHGGLLLLLLLCNGACTIARRRSCHDHPHVICLAHQKV